MILNSLIKQQILKPGANIPKWLADNTQYLVQMGSVAYGCNTDDSDMDVYGFCIPPKDYVFPYSFKQHILGFGPKPKVFEQWQMTHLKSADGKREYDFSVYNIVKFFQLVAENNPNMLSAAWVPQRCVMHITPIGQMFRDRRQEFLHKGSYHKMWGYLFSQLNKIRNKTAHSNAKRAADIEKYGMDCKYAYHCIRLSLELEQLLSTGDMDIQRDREIYKSIRRGDWTLEQVESFVEKKGVHLTELYEKTKLPESPDWNRLQKLLLDSLEMHYGSLQLASISIQPIEKLIGDLENLIGNYKS